MKKLIGLAALVAAMLLPAHAQTVTLMSPQLKDTAGLPVADGIASITPTLCNGIPTAYRVIGGGTRTQTPVTVPVVAGVVSLTVADTAQTSPRICYAMTVRDRTTGAVLIGKGYDKMQPSAAASWCSTVAGVTTCNVDNYDPNLVPVVPVGPAGAAGPQGPAGPPGPQGPPGTGSVVSDGSIPAGATGSDPVAAANTAANQVITVGPVTPPQNTVIPLFAGSAIRDIRPGYEGLRYLDCLVQSKMHDVRAGDGSHCRWDHVTFDGQTNMGFNQQGLHFNSLWSYGASANYSSNWRTVSVESVNATVANRGIFNGANLYYHHNAAGDINLHNLYAWFDSGWRTGADEGFTGIRGTFIQNPTYWHGTSLSAGTGLTMPLLSDSTAPASGAGENNNHTTDGGFVVNISKGTLSGTVTGPAVPVPGSVYLYQFPTSSTTLPLITAWGTCASAIAESTVAQTNQPISCVATVKAGTFTAGGLVLVAGQQGTSEQAPITAVSTKTGGVQTLTIATRHRYAAGATVFQGPSSLYASWDANLASTGMRTAYPTFGSLDGTNLIFGFYPQGTYTANIPDCGKQAFCPGTTGRNGFHLYPGAEVRANLSLFHDPWLEPNSMVLTAGDLLEAPQPDEVYMTGLKLACAPATPANGAEQACDRVTVGGTGMVSNFAARLTLNTNNPPIYRANGGIYDGTPAHWIRGYFDHGHLFDIMPGIALTTVYNMNYLQQAGDHSLGNNRGLLYKMPSGNIWWWDDVARLYTPNIGADNYFGPSTAPTGSCTTAQAGAWAFPQDGVASYCDLATHTWVPQVKQVIAGAGIQVTATTPTSLNIATAAIPNSSLANPAATINGQTCTLGSTCTVPAAAATLTGSALPSAITSAPGLAAAFDPANAAATVQAASLQKSQNLADLPNASTARTNLGLGTAALLAAPAGAIVGTTDTQSLTNKTVDGVSPATMAFVDATSSIQAQLNGKLGATANAVTASSTPASGLTGAALPANITSAPALALPIGQVTGLGSAAALSAVAGTPSPATAAAAGSAYLPAYNGLVATRGIMATQGNSGLTWITTRTQHYARTAIPAGTIKIVWGNYFGPTESNYGAGVYKASIEYPLGTITACTFGGSATKSVAGGVDAITDPCGPAIPNGVPFWIRSLYTNPSGIMFATTSNPSNIDGGSNGTGTPTDLTTGGTANPNGAILPPLAITGSTSQASICIAGDSRQAGTNDNNTDATGDLGEMARMLGPFYAYAKLALPGDRVSVALSNYTNRLRTIAYCSLVVDAYGTNDLSASNTAATVATNRASFATLMAKPVWGTTIMNQTSSTDNWTTTANQTITVDARALNSLIRLGIAGEVGMLDVANALDPLSLGLWPVSPIAGTTAYTYTFTGNTTSGSSNITNVINAGIINPLQTITGSGIPANAQVQSVSGTTVSLGANATATATGVTFSALSYATIDGVHESPNTYRQISRILGYAATWLRR